MEIFSQAFFRDVSTTSVPLTSLKQNGCYCGREGFLCAGISEDELRYSCTASFQKTSLRQPTLPLSIRINTGSLYRIVSILNYKRDKDNVS